MDPTHEACGFDLHLFYRVYGFKLWCSFRTCTLSTGYDNSNKLFVTVPSALASQMLAAQLSSQQQNMYVFCFIFNYDYLRNYPHCSLKFQLIIFHKSKYKKTIKINLEILNVNTLSTRFDLLSTAQSTRRLSLNQNVSTLFNAILSTSTIAYLLNVCRM